MAIDLTALARSGVATAFKTIENNLKAGILRVPSTGTYDPVTDTRSGTPTDYALNGLFYQTREQKLAEDASRTGMILLQRVDLIDAGLTAVPTQANQWVMDGITWTIDLVAADPADAVVMLTIRR